MTGPPLRKENIILDLEAKNKDGVIKELAEVLHRQCRNVHLKTILKVVREREAIGSTGVGNGVAIPHGKIAQLDHIILAFGRSLNGINYDAIDNQPVHLLVMILTPRGATDDYLKMLANVSRLLKQPETRRILRTTKDKQEVADLFRDQLQAPE